VFQIGFPTPTIFFRFASLPSYFSRASNQFRSYLKLKKMLTCGALRPVALSPRPASCRYLDATSRVRGVPPLSDTALASPHAQPRQPVSEAAAAFPLLTARVRVHHTTIAARMRFAAYARVSTPRRRFLSALAAVLTSLPSPRALVVGRLTLFVSVQVSAEPSRRAPRRRPSNRRASTPLPGELTAPPVLLRNHRHSERVAGPPASVKSPLSSTRPALPRALRPGAPCGLGSLRRCGLRGRTAVGRGHRSASGPRRHCAAGPRADSAQWHLICFSIFRIYSNPCKFKNLCMIHLKLENYETNFVG
jgi:hypothetical protein